MENERQRIGQRLRERRNEINVSASHMARRIGISRTAISRMERGQQKIPAELIKVWATALLWDCDSLLSDKSPKLSDNETAHQRTVKYLIMLQKLDKDFRQPVFNLIEDVYRLFLQVKAKR